MNTFIKIIPGNETVIYNKISTSDGIKSCYPDILFKHNFKETELIDDETYVELNNAIKAYGSSFCLVAKASENDSMTLQNLFLQSLRKDNLSEPDEYLIKFSDDLRLSETMKKSFLSLMAYYLETGNDPHALIEPFYKEYALPVALKTEGKKIYELIRNSVLG